MQGVRQLGPSEVLASAPGGSDSIVSETLAPLVMLLGRKFQLGVPDAQPADEQGAGDGANAYQGCHCTLRPGAPAPARGP